MSGEDQLFQRYGRVFPAGSVLFREDEPGGEMFVIQSGVVRITRRSRGKEKLLATLGPGEFFGEMSIISSRPRTASAEVVTEARMLVIDAKTFDAMVRSNVEIAVRLIKKFAERLAEADAQIENLLLRDASSRVVHHFARLVATQGRQSPDGTHVQVNVATLPSLLGIEPDQVDDVLAKMGRARICLPADGGYVVPKPEQLHDFLDFLEKRERYAGLA
ncbi:Crp/Fnr family transcriptional regulator [Vulgatibacter sp.]|uniref:Crp/Fnr family transcriptional regulator n=1 Tax=Vulgatibacter sp. TaxID=1971226 RepID=UPI003569C890